MEQDPAVVINKVNGKLLLPSEGMRIFPRCNHIELCIPYTFPVSWKHESSQPCSLGTYRSLTVSWPPITFTGAGSALGMVIKRKGKGVSNHLSGRPMGLILLGLFLSPIFALSGDHPLRRVMNCMLGWEVKQGEKYSVLRRRGKLWGSQGDYLPTQLS